MSLHADVQYSYILCLFKAYWSVPWAADVIFGKLDSVLCEFINNKINNYWWGSWENGISGKFVPNWSVQKLPNFCIQTDLEGDMASGFVINISLSHSFVVRFVWSWLGCNNFEEAKGRKKCAGKTLTFYLFCFVMANYLLNIFWQAMICHFS